MSETARKRLVKFDVFSAPQDPEKAVLPCLIFVSARHPEFAKYRCGGFSLSLGWWHWGVRLSLFYSPRPGEITRG